MREKEEYWIEDYWDMTDWLLQHSACYHLKYQQKAQCYWQDGLLKFFLD